MADNPEIARAKRLLKRGDELLEASRNRPHVERSSFHNLSKRANTHDLPPVVRKTIEQPRQRGKMDAASSEAWTAWATRIATRQCHALSKIVADAIVAQHKRLSEATQEALDKRDKRIAELERDVAKLKGQQPPALKAVGGRDA